MQSIKPRPTNLELYCPSSFFLRGDSCTPSQTRIPDFGELDPPIAASFNNNNSVNLSPSSISNLKSGNVFVLANNLHYGAFNSSTGPTEIISETVQFSYQKEGTIGTQFGNGHVENWGDSGVADKNQFHGGLGGSVNTVDSSKRSKRKHDQKMLRRLAQNREAARKSRLRRKAYVKQLENSRLKLTQLEQELQRAKQQGMFISSGLSGDHGHPVTGNGTLAFDVEYARWLDEHQRMINGLRSAVNSHTGDNKLSILVNGLMAHYDELFRLKTIGIKADVFHMLSGMWSTPVERCFMWLGGFRSSELLKILENYLKPLTDQQLIGIYNLQQSSQQTEDALSQGLEALQQSLLDTLSSPSRGPAGSTNVSDYMGQMTYAMSQLATLENLLHLADLLRLQTLQQMHRILTARQVAHVLLVISDFTFRLRALSSLWLARHTL